MPGLEKTALLFQQRETPHQHTVYTTAGKSSTRVPGCMPESQSRHAGMGKLNPKSSSLCTGLLIYNCIMQGSFEEGSRADAR